MSRLDYRRQALLARIHTTIDDFYLRQQIDWDYDIRKILDHILGLAVSELEFGEGKRIDRALIVVRRLSGEELEVGAGWRVGDEGIEFSRTIIEETIDTARPVLCENARQDPRFEKAESIRRLDVLSLLAVPILTESGTLGAIYIERRDAGHLFTAADRDFLGEFANTIAPYIKTALIHQDHVAKIRNLKAVIDQSAQMPNIIGRSQSVTKVIELARIAASVERTVLITGESGSGKELIARAIHARSRRADKPFVVVDCSALSENLLESELFGHRRGSFTGAVADKPGAFEEANGGTLFLDEVSDASKAMQQQLRRVLQEGEIRRVGETAYRKVDVRVICATNRALTDEVAQGRFIHDLYHRLLQFPVRLPSLRERKEDIPILVEHFIAGSGGRKNPPVRGITPDALQLLVTRDWRANNVRELKNVVELAVDLAGSELVDRKTIERTLEIREELTEADGPDARAGDKKHGVTGIEIGFAGECLYLDGNRTAALFQQTLDDAPKEIRAWYLLEREFAGKLIIESLRHTGWKLRPAARLLGISPVKFRQHLRDYLALLIEAHPAGGDEALAGVLGIPPEMLQRKLLDLGIENGGGGRGRTTSGRAGGAA